MPDTTEPSDETRPSRRQLARRRRELLREPDRLVTRREAAQLAGISLDTVDRRVRPLTGEGRTPWGAVGLPAAALAQQLREPWPGRGRAALLDGAVVSRIVSQRRAGWTFAAIAAALNEDGVETAHGGVRWWPATVRKVVVTVERGPLAAFGPVRVSVYAGFGGTTRRRRSSRHPHA